MQHKHPHVHRVAMRTGVARIDIFRMRSYRENADKVPTLTGRRGQLSRDEFRLAEVVNCTVVADLGPLARARSAP